MNLKFKSVCFIFVVSILLLLFSGCKVNQVSVGYKPPGIPLKLVVDTRGNVSIEGEASLVTLVGEFSIGAPYQLIHEEDSLLVIIRNTKRGLTGLDTIYRIRSNYNDKLIAVINGETTLQIENKQVLIDTSDGSIKRIEFKEGTSAISKGNGFFKPFPLRYHPFLFTEWAYDDSTMGKWYGIGFLWFVVRLAFAIIMLVLDFIVIIVLGIGVLLHSIFGVTARNVYFGLLALLIIIISTAIISDSL